MDRGYVDVTKEVSSRGGIFLVANTGFRGHLIIEFEKPHCVFQLKLKTKLATSVTIESSPTHWPASQNVSGK